MRISSFATTHPGSDQERRATFSLDPQAASPPIATAVPCVGRLGRADDNVETATGQIRPGGRVSSAARGARHLLLEDSLPAPAGVRAAALSLRRPRLTLA